MHRKIAVAVLLAMLVLPVLPCRTSEKYAGTWNGTFKSESGGGGQVSYTFRRMTREPGRDRSSIRTTRELRWRPQGYDDRERALQG
jgi:hypothetical protein